MEIDEKLAGPPPANPLEAAARAPSYGASRVPGKSSASAAAEFVVLTGNPNSGKTTVFNALTGLRARVGNYAGVTVERKEGRLQGHPPERPVRVLDLPGAYSLSPQSLDEQIARDVLFQRLADVPKPGAVIVVVDASNLERNLYFASQVIELGYPTIVALNMTDVAEDNGTAIDGGELGAGLGVPVVPMIASSGEGVQDLKEAIAQTLRDGRQTGTPHMFCELPALFEKETQAMTQMLVSEKRAVFPQPEALLILSDEKFLAGSAGNYSSAIRQAAVAARQRLESAGIDWRSIAIESRYARVAAIQQAASRQTRPETETFSDKVDQIVTHKFWGMLIFVSIMTLMFLSIFTLAQPPMDLLKGIFGAMGEALARVMPPGDLESLLDKGVIGGVGAVVVFLPQICMLFLFIGLLEDTGYMARAAFLMDRLMSKVGLHGKSFIPMLSSFACAIPGIMATRTIETPKDRLVTILVAPLMSCSARLPVYILLIGACIPAGKLVKSLTMLVMYLLGIVVALALAWVFKKTLLKGETPMLVMELPPYKRPLLKIVLRHMWDRSKLFLRRAGTVILGINILLWFLATYPKHPEVTRQFAAERAAITADASAAKPARLTPEQQKQIDQLGTDEAGEKVRRSFAGQAGRLIEPLIAPLGFDWKIGIGIVSSFAAREVFVSTMSIVYNVAEGPGESHQKLELVLRDQKRPDGSRIFTPLTAITLMVFYVLALQCVSTVAVVRRETNSWKWPIFQWLYMGALAWSLAFITYHGGRLLGFS